MLRLDSYLRYDRHACESPNLTSRFSEEDLYRIGDHCFRGYERDEMSRAGWLNRTQAAMDLALQVSKEKTFPWPNSSNVAFPLVTIAALQFHARSYPTLFAGPDLVKYRVPGIDVSGELTARANLVARYMSHQVLDLDESFEEQHDRLLVNVPIVGCAFIKTRRDVSRGINSSTLVLARDLVVDYWAKSIDGAARKTQLIPLYRNEVYERCVAGTFRDIRKEAWYTSPTQPFTLPHLAAVDKRQGVAAGEPDEATPLIFGEQHCWLDLDNDGYAEPYIITLDLASKQVVRIAARWQKPEDCEMVRNKLFRINATEYFTKYGLIPAPDGSIYDVGFGVLLGPLNESVNTLVNQLIDAGTMSVAAGGFISKGVKIRSGLITFQPFGWQRVESTGDDLQKGIFPLPVREPSSVLFSLLQLLINYTQRISGSGDTMVGENPGQNTPANNMNIMVEQGMQVYSASFKRLWRSMRDEFRKCYSLNARFMDDAVRFGEGVVTRAMFLEDPSHLVPAADPNLTSETQRLQRAVTLKQFAAGTPGYDVAAVERDVLRTMRVDNIDVIYPGPDKVPQGKDPKLAIEEMRLQAGQAKLQFEAEKFMAELVEQRRLNDAKIVQLQTSAAVAVAGLEGDAKQAEIDRFNSAIQAAKADADSVTQRISAVAAFMQASQPEPAGKKAEK